MVSTPIMVRQIVQIKDEQQRDAIICLIKMHLRSASDSTSGAMLPLLEVSCYLCNTCVVTGTKLYASYFLLCLSV